MFFTPKQQDQSQRLEILGRFAGGIAHDFNNILSIIDAAARYAEKDPAAFSSHVGKIIRATERGAALTRQLLAFGQQHVSLGDVSDVCTEVMAHEELLKAMLGEKISLVLDLPQEPVYVAASSAELSQVILNLSLNARVSIKDQGKISIAIAFIKPSGVPRGLMREVPAEGAARLSITDSGCGIAPADLPRIFDPFFTTRRAEGGSGLGLSVVHGIVAHYAGGINVDSTQGKGTRVDIYFPASAEVIAQNSVQDIQLQELAGKTVLLAEDEEDLRSILALMLKDMKMKVLEAGNGNEAISLEADYDGEIDFLLTDVIMPGIDGLTLGELFLRKQPKTNVVYMSGYPFIGDTASGHRLPEGADFISKPLHSEKVRDILERALARRDLRQDADEDFPPSR